MMKYCILFMTSVVLIISMIENANSDSAKIDAVPISREVALACALEYTGFREFAGLSKIEPKIETFVLNDDRTPFLKDSINGKPIWKISFSHVLLQDKSFDTTGRCTNLCDFDVFLDKETGRLLKIASISSILDTSIAPEPPAENAERQLSEDGELYSGFPTSQTLISFRTALNSCMLFNPFKAKEISALLILYSAKAYPDYVSPKPVWAITLRGIKPRPSPQPIRNAPPVPLYQSNYIRQLINAATGKAMIASGIPTVEPRK